MHGENNMKQRVVFIISTIVLISLAQFTYSQDSIRLNIEKHIDTLSSSSMMGRYSGSIYANKSAEYIKAEFERIGIKTFYQTIYNNPNLKNVVGIIEGSDERLRKEWIVIGAHYDHLGFQTGNSRTYILNDSLGKIRSVTITAKTPIFDSDTLIYNGADDNASGISSLIELARMLYSNRQILKRSIAIIAFDANETGRNGSTYIANNGMAPYFGEYDVKFMMSIDMVGHLKANNELMVIGCGMLYKYQKYFENLSIRKPNKIILKEFDINNSMVSDNEPYARMGIPSILISTGIKHHYHKIWDDAKYIDFQGIEDITNYSFSLINKFANTRLILPSGRSQYGLIPVRKNYFGVSFGFGNNEHYYKNGTMTGKITDGESIGIFYRYNLSELFAIKAEFDYEYKQASRVFGSMTYHSLSLPVSFVVKYTTINNEFDFSLGLGAFYSYNIGDKYDLNEETLSPKINRNTIGLNYNFGVRYKRCVIGYEAKYGYYNILDSPYGPTRPINKFIKIGYIL